MHFSGHLGIGFIVVTPIYILMRTLGIELGPAIIVTIIAACYSWIPDLDMEFGIKHRGITHTIPFGALIALIISLLFASTFLNWFFAFFSLLLAFLIHILGDMMNIVKMQIFSPFSKKQYGGWKWFKSANENANYNFFIAGIIFYVLGLSFF